MALWGLVLKMRALLRCINFINSITKRSMQYLWLTFTHSRLYQDVAVCIPLKTNVRVRLFVMEEQVFLGGDLMYTDK
jgi:hypothetical protein